MKPINIRTIQHYLYCPRRFGLLEINDDWQENALVVKGNLVHERVHSGEHSFSSKTVTVESSVQLYNDELEIFGVADCVEFRPDKNAEFSERLGGNFSVCVVEYKPTRPKNGEISVPDAVQVFAQKLCADSIFGVRCDGVVYYSDVKRRVKLPFDEEYNKYYSLVTRLLSEMRGILESGVIPNRAPKQNCSGCSLESVCMPKCSSYSVQKEIQKQMLRAPTYIKLLL